MLCFDLTDKQNNELSDALQITDGMTGRQFMFKIQGYVHGQTVFTDHIHYLLKGGKLMKCALETINAYRQMITEVHKLPSECSVDQKYYLEDAKGHLHQIPLYDHKARRINYMRKRNFLVKAANLPKQFGFEVDVKNLHYDDRKPVLAKHLVLGRSFISKLFFVFNINELLMEDNQDMYHALPFDGQDTDASFHQNSFV